MQTQCPHCETRFRVTETQVNIADGLVRCGVCHEVFNAFEVANDAQKPSLLETDALSTPLESGTEDEPKQADSHASPEAQQDSNLSEYTTLESNSEAKDIEQAQVASKSQKDTFDFFNDDDDEEVPQHVVPEKFRDNYARQSPSVISTLLWSIGILLLTASLISEYAWFNRGQLDQVPQLQAWLDKLCQRVECKNIKMRDPAKIELLTRNVYSHPNAKLALMVDVTMRNTADFAQPYPVMQIDFSDVRGGTVAARRFLPNEYLPIENLQNNIAGTPLLQPGESASITMEIQDPGKQAMTYEFNFL